MPTREGVPTLSLDELREIAESQQEDLQRVANQGIRKKDWEQGIGALASIDAVREFIRLCEQRAGMYARYEDAKARLKAGAKITTLPPASPAVRKRQTKQGADPDTLPGWARERVK